MERVDDAHRHRLVSAAMAMNMQLFNMVILMKLEWKCKCCGICVFRVPSGSVVLRTYKVGARMCRNVSPFRGFS
ncbi:hypothetical protein BDU57DRAFT_517327 [Ampelomyces quisqualis]|uniref:Uncharacterized protein n=1 Tax=Ampelomyces quisqualis TaxID=50730 RepID=A0A6A5QPX3_AMPQU|nr:hypothetical protein BDU57DRAFT_517327 [Ampelomyces quisqualis]